MKHMKLVALVAASVMMLSMVSIVSADPISEPTTSDMTIYAYASDNIEWQEVDSSCFSEVAYDAVLSWLYVRFRDSGVAYVYTDFGTDEWTAFITADSLGKWYNQNIEGQYPIMRLLEE